YMAPEQIRGDAIDGRADQFAWGVLAYELLAGKLPWRGGDDALAVMASVLIDPVDGVAIEQTGVSPAVARVVLRALEKRPGARFASMDDLQSALESAERGEALVEPPKADPALGTTMAQQFSPSEVREVLGKAIERQAARQSSAKLGFDDLIDVAAEVGVDVASLREASRALRSRGEEEETALAKAAKRDAWLRQQRLMFYRHVGIYAIVNAALLVLGLALLSFTPWWIWFLPALAWGVGVAIHGLIAFTSNEHDWTEHNEGMKWWLENRNRRHEVALAQVADPMAGDRVVREASRTGIHPLLLAEKVRVAAGTGGDQADEEGEDALADHPAATPRRR
ncbi:MAG: 2TM domain-containing protein, partial [Polyangiaceae bacterium]